MQLYDPTEDPIRKKLIDQLLGNSDSGGFDPGMADTTSLPGSSPLDDGIYAQKRALALKQYQDQLLGLDTNWQKFLTTSGVNAQYDPSGKFTGYDANPLSQYGVYQQMLRGQSDNLDTLRNDSYDRGLHGKGLGAQETSNYRYDMGNDRLNFGRSVMDQYGNWSGGKQQAKSAYDKSLLDIEQQRIYDSISNNSFDETPNNAQPSSGGSGSSSNSGASYTGYAAMQTPAAQTALAARNAASMTLARQTAAGKAPLPPKGTRPYQLPAPKPKPVAAWKQSTPSYLKSSIYYRR